MSSVGSESKHAGAAGAPRPGLSDAQGSGRVDDIVIGPGVRTAGKFQTAGGIFVDGTLEEADIACRWLSVSRGAELHGIVSAERVEIAGLLNGDATAKEEIILRSTAVVTGKISAPYIVVHRGAQISGGVESTERPADHRKQMSMPPLPRSRPRRPLNIFLCAAALGLLLSGGAYALWGGATAQAGQPETAASST